MDPSIAIDAFSELAESGVVTSAASAFSRRKLLKGGLAGLLVVAASSVGLAVQRTRLRSLPAEGLKVLSEQEYAILSAIAERLCPEAEPGVPGAEGVDVALLADRLFERADDDAREGLRVALGFVESGLFGAVAFERVKPFTQLSPEAQTRALEGFRDSRLPLRRTIFRSFSGLVGSLYYSDPRSWASTGYPGPPDPKRLRSAYSAQLVDLGSLQARLKAGG